MTFATIIFASVAAIFMFDYLTVKARERQDRKRDELEQRKLDETLAAGIRLGLAAGRVEERQRIFEALTTDTAELPPVVPLRPNLHLIHKAETPGVGPEAS